MLSTALRLIRTFHDLKQADAADLVGISKSYISEIESGSKTPTLQLIDRYAEAFDIPASSILFFAENIDGRGSKEKARRIVASKIVSMLEFIEAKSVRAKDERSKVPHA